MTLHRCWPPLVFSLAALAIVVACKGTDPFVPQATSIQLSATTVNFASIGASQQLTAVVFDQRGDTMAATVVWSSNDNGVATVTPAGLVAAAGNGSTQVVAGAGPVNAQAAVTVAQVAAQIIKTKGDQQTDTVGNTLPIPLAVRVNDGRGNPMQNVTVNLAVIAGGGSLSASSALTDGTGVIPDIFWTLGSTVGPQSVQVSVPAGTAAPVTFGATAASGPPVAVVRQAGDSQSAAVGNPVAIDPAVRVLDAFNNPVANAVVVFAVSAGGGSLTGATDTTGASGIATVGSWTLGAAGTNNLTATVSGTALSFTFDATALVPGAPASVVVIAGDNQTGLIGYAVNFDPSVRVLDAASLPVPNVQVDFVVATGGGSVSGGSVMTAIDGTATVDSWTVGAGANSLTATVTGAGIAGNPVTFSATGAAAAFHIDVRYPLGVTPAQKEVFDSAVAFWERTIFGDLPGAFAMFTAPCGPGTPDINEFVDDVIIFAMLDSIDGPGNVLGGATPCLIRQGSLLPGLGIMTFDTADIATTIALGEFDEIVMHEMGHVLGFGTIWQGLGLLVGPARTGGTDPHFIGSQAVAAFDANGGANYSAGVRVPVENCIGLPPGLPCGQGQFDGHWRETVFGDELMSSYLDTGANPFSVITVAAMGDLGYLVNYAAAQNYTVVNPSALPQLRRAMRPLRDVILRIPIIVIDAQGRVVERIPPR